MRLRRGRATVALLIVACAVVAGGVIAALVTTNHGHKSSEALAPTTGLWAPLTVPRPKVPVIAGGIPVDIDPMSIPTYFTTTLTPLSAPRRYRMTVFNISNLGDVNSFQWFPPIGVHVVKLLGTSAGHCTVSGLTGFGGNQFPTVVLNQNILCDKLDMKAPSCTCLGNGGAVTLTFATDKDIAVGEGDLRMLAATPVFNRIPGYVRTHPASAPVIQRVVTANVDAGGLTARQRADAQSAVDSLQGSNIALQLVTISRWVQGAPTTCRVRLVSQNPATYAAYVFWTPWLAAEPYVWLNMHFTKDPRTGAFQLGTVQPVLPGGRLRANGQTINRTSVDTTLLSIYGAPQAKKGRELLLAHGGNVFAQPGASCQVLANGSLRLLPTK
jgi:hypothetical protein